MSPEQQPHTATQSRPAQRGLIFVLSGPSGVGKGTLCKALLQQIPNLCLTVSTTSRPKRPDETEGVDYHFVSPDAFLMLAEAGAFLEWAEYNENFYGTACKEVETLLNEGRYLLLEIDVKGALAVKTQIPEALLVFIAPPSLETLKERLENRGTNTPEDIEKRLRIGREELAKQGHFPHVFVNDRLTETIGALVSFFNQTIQAHSHQAQGTVAAPIEADVDTDLGF